MSDFRYRGGRRILKLQEAAGSPSAARLRSRRQYEDTHPLRGRASVVWPESGEQMFDPYRKWLGIPEDHRPPTHYQLLGISPDEQDIEVIEAAVLRQSAFVRNFQAGAHADDANRILNEIAAARLCLIDRRKRAKYDAELSGSQGSKPASHSSARHSDLGIDVTPARAAPAPRQSTQPALPPVAPSIDLDQIFGPAAQRPAAAGRRVKLSRQPGGRQAAGRRRSQQANVGYAWQVPLLTVIVIILLLLARTIGHSIAEQRALKTPAVQQERVE